jgi:DNA polymerase elongation subunit (family B)
MNRGDTPPFIAAAQQEILQILAALPEERPLVDALPQIVSHLRGVIAALRGLQFSPEMLLVTHRVSRLPDEFRAASPAARALRQLAALGQKRRPGQRIQFIYTRGEPGVYAWDLPEPFNPATVDAARYSDLLIRAAHTILQPLGVSKEQTQTWLLNQATQLQLRI